jgi:UPF0755 protein
VADQPHWDDLFSSQPDAPDPGDRGDGTPTRSRTGLLQSPEEIRETPRPTPRRRRGRTALGVIGALLAVGAVLGVGVGAAWLAFEEPIRDLLGQQEPIDYEGTGTDDIVVTITNGQTGGDVAQTLADSGVTKTYEAFYGLLLAQPEVVFQPGSYALRTEMSAAAALAALTDPASKVFTQASIPEGTTVEGVLDILGNVSESTGVTRDDLAAAAADYGSFGLPAEAPRLEGYLFPATYSFDPGLSAHDMLQRMVDETFRRLDALGVPAAERHRVLTLAAMTQKEGGSEEDFFKVARVWENRLAVPQNLQSDATVSYGSGGTTIATSDAARADASNPYNTYANPGLPVGPICNPGEAAMQATQAPAEGDWLYFVLVDGDTGETAFTSDYADHLRNVDRWTAWLAAHPDFSG